MNNATTFNVGDKVEITDLAIYENADDADQHPKFGLVVGNTGTVVRVLSGGRAYKVRTDNAEFPSDDAPFDDAPNKGWFFYGNNLKKVEG